MGALKTALLTNAFTDIGANASAEEAEEGVEDQEIKVNNIVNSFRLQSTQFDKKSYLTYLKGTCAPMIRTQQRSGFNLANDAIPGYMKAVKAYLVEQGKSEEEVKKFESGAQKFVKEKLLPNFKDWEFYTGESMNPDGM
jgi:hypothetical protein